ncbi:MAG: hypothetical protein J1E62_06615 [Lachnospiraceae bacterium]|nr:hypothetical protein [Lachnospiraceae bacterium]
MNQMPFSLKYETTLEYPISMYDKLPYKRDSDYCNAEHIGLTCGKIIKYFLCLNQMEGFLVDNHDEEIQQILAEVQRREQERLLALKSKADAVEASDEITEKQIQTLLEDQGEDENGTTPAHTPSESLSDPTNPFADVEDW